MRRILFSMATMAVMSLPVFAAAAPLREDVLATMRTATDFMFETLANQGGFVWFYTTDLVPYGELKARPSMIWVEPPGTPSVGLMLLEAYKTTGDEYYLDRAQEVAEGLTLGQHLSGGWNYFIDFDPEGLPFYYESFFSKCWGWQEYLKPRSNCTFDDFATSEPTRFFLRLHGVTNDPAHKLVLNKALDHILRAQYPDGGWPQRFPNAEADHDYTAARTFNDGVIRDCIDVLLEAHGQLGDEKLRAAAVRGMDFYLLSQQRAPQAGWAQQHGDDLMPVWGRPFEIGTVCTAQTAENIQDLFDFYGITGEKKYLTSVPAALDWLESCRLPDAEGFTHTGYHEAGTNRPVYIKQTGTTIDDVMYTLTYDSEGCYPYNHQLTFDVEGIRRKYSQLLETPSEAAMDAYRKGKARHQLPEVVKGGHLAVALQKTTQTPEGIAEILGSLDERGGWRDNVTQLDPFSPFTEPPLKTEGYIVGGYLARMYRLINYLRD